jgi:signal transduction histidine kinase
MQTLPANRQKQLFSPGLHSRSTRRSLAAAFATFSQTAGALESTYAKLQAEVGRLRHELEDKNRSLAQSLEENQRMRTYLAKILEGLPCGVAVFDGEMALRLMNPAATHLLDLGRDGHALSRTSIQQILGPLLKSIPPSDPAREMEWVVQGSAGERMLGVTRALFRAHEPDGESIVILRDLTDAKQLEREREFSRRSQALGEVATLLAHEVRNPLASLELFAGLLAGTLAGQPEPQSWINHIQAGLRSLAATVNNVLQFHSQPRAQLLPVDLGRLVGETLDFLRPLARQKEMRIDWRAPSVCVPILADPSRLQQAFLNLALNAFRAMRPGGILSVTIQPLRETSLFALTFADQGCGIRAEDLEKIFDAGFTTQSSSPGLGLAVTQKVIEQHGGTVQVESREGRGTTFTLTLPLAGGSGGQEGMGLRRSFDHPIAGSPDPSIKRKVE